MEPPYLLDINMLNNIMNGKIEYYLAIFNHHVHHIIKIYKVIIYMGS
jgi:hypothetical protein